MSRRLEIAAAVSILLHLALLAWVGGFLAGRAPAPDKPDTPPAIELRLVERQGEIGPGASTSSAAPAATPAAAPANTPETERPTEPRPPPAPVPTEASGIETPDRSVASGSAPPASKREQPNTALADPTPPTPAPAAPLEMNLGGTESESNALATGVIPAGLDQRARNRPPVYPQEAARLGQQGAVVLLIHISPDGAATGSDVMETSGYEALDLAAQQAVARWRFRPGMKDGHPVASDMPMRFVFEFN